MKKSLLKAVAVFVIISLIACVFASCSKSDNKTVSSTVSETKSDEIKATFIGIKDVNTITRDVVFSDKSEIFQFEIDGAVKEYCVKCSEGDYSIQNRLMMGYEYYIKLDGNTVTDVRIANEKDTKGVVNGYTAGERTVKNFLKTALAPMGKTIYVYGGGWNVEDDGGSFMSRTIGLSPTWEKFYKTTNENYSFENDTYPQNEWNTYYYAGLDCSGYVGWTLYNTIYTETEKEESFVGSSTKMAKRLSTDYKFGTWNHPTETDYKSIINKLHPGDIVSIPGHVYIVLGTCDDTSAVIIHSTVTKSVSGVEGGGVQISAVSAKGDNDTSCKAYKLAKEYAEKYYPDWTAKYPVTLKPVSTYFTFPAEKEESGIFTWNTDESGLIDSENIKNMTAEEVLKLLFESK